MLSWETSSKHTPTNGVEDNHRMSFTVFLGNLPAWVTADDIKGWLTAENLVADAIKVIRNPETQESKGFAFIEAPNTEEMNSIIRRFDRAPLEDRLLRANPAQPARPKGQQGRPMGGPGGPGPSQGAPSSGHNAERGATAAPRAGHAEGHSAAPQGAEHRTPPPPRRAKKTFTKRSESRGPQSSFAEELAKAL
jgi:RNA recognition motif-containing protein